MLQDNVDLILVLGAKDTNHGVDAFAPGKCKLLYVVFPLVCWIHFLQRSFKKNKIGFCLSNKIVGWKC